MNALLHPVGRRHRRSTYLWVVHTDEREEKDGERDLPSSIPSSLPSFLTFVMGNQTALDTWRAGATPPPTITIAIAVVLLFHEERLCKGISRWLRRGWRRRERKEDVSALPSEEEQGRDGDFGNEWPDKLAQ